MTARWARPYLLTGGRTLTRRPLHTHTLVSAPFYDELCAERLLPEARALYQRARSGPLSIAELSAYTEISLGVTRVLISDLADTGELVIHPETHASAYDTSLLERVLDGLRQFT